MFRSNEKKSHSPDEQLSEAIQRSNTKEVYRLLNDQTLNLSVNTVDPATGRTHLHEAASYPSEKHKALYKEFVKEYKGNQRIRDKEGYTPAELAVYPHPIDEETIAKAEMWKYYVLYFIGELNAKLESKMTTSTNNKHLELVDNTEQMLEFVKTHPQYKQIGFILRKPNAIRVGPYFHHSPILFDRPKRLFVQLDSLGSTFLIPQTAENYRFIYSPFYRHYSVSGCIEDAMALAYHILTKYSNFFRFCLAHNVEAKDRLILTPRDSGALPLFFSESAFKKEYYRRLRKEEIQTELRVFSAYDQKPMPIRVLTKWPVPLVTFIERFDALYHLRNIHDLGNPVNTAHVNRLLAIGEKRTSSVSNTTLLENLVIDKNKPYDNKFDMGGVSLDKRMEQWKNSYKQRSKLVSRLFDTKLKSVSHLTDAQKDETVDRILSFSSLRRYE